MNHLVKQFDSFKVIVDKTLYETFHLGPEAAENVF